MRRGMKKVYRCAERHVHETFLYDHHGDLDNKGDLGNKGRTSGSSSSSSRAIGSSARDFEGKYFFRDYALQEKLGEGGSARVFKAAAKGSRAGSSASTAVYAVKRIKRRGLSDAGKRKLDEEVYILRALEHPNIVSIYQFYEHDPLYYYMVTEFMAGGELFRRIMQKYSRKEGYNEEQARDLCRVLLGAVKYCHDRGVVHRDLKPENLLLASETDDASIKIADFGLACSVLDGPVDGWCGTPGYMAPEILLGKPYGTSVDMWSIGVIIYLLLGGSLPFDARHTVQIFQKTKAGDFHFYEEHWGDASPEAKEFIRKLLVVDETERMTADEAVSHPWLHAPGARLSTHDLSDSLERFGVFNAKRKLRTAITSVMLARRLASCLEDPSAELSAETSPNFSDAFVLGEKIGSGTFATVFKATAVEGPVVAAAAAAAPQTCFAVKRTVRKDLSKKDEQSVFEEVRLMRMLDHPNVVAIYNFYKADPEYYYVVLEFMAGGHLLDRIVRKNCYNEEEARDMCRILLGAVRYCHDRGVMHRDLKLENLLLASEMDDASIKLADFGLACSVRKGGLTAVCGSPGYVAPEILKGVRYGTPADMWSVGVIIFIVLCGRRPFHDKDQTRLFQKIKAGKFVFREEHWGGVSPEAKDLVRKLLTVDPQRRMTASDAAKHPWLLIKGPTLARHSLERNLNQLRIFNATRKLRAAIRSVVATNKLASTLGIPLHDG